ncbi:unnamed protein product [Paramecium sonneborni]|uniref:Uncharacterized protein n=1 Tax=Paramecium sonneborni TaxID=65129 RepID=A0A8S1P3M2_9CILI|nr:unnamed protein product [Paramecium sonneborni]
MVVVLIVNINAVKIVQFVKKEYLQKTVQKYDCFRELMQVNMRINDG